MSIFEYIESNPLLFTNIAFWIFFAVLLLGYTWVYQRPKARSLYLLIFSLFFYYKSSGLFFLLLIFTTTVNFAIGLQIPKQKKRNKRKLLVASSITINLLLLSYFKYAYLFINVVNSLFGTEFEVVNVLAVWANSLGGDFSIDQIVLPVGISFYLFQTISYIIDVYREKLRPERNFIDFAFYVSFFPQLVAGPIVRATDFIPQIHRQYRLSQREFGHAMFLILAGLVKKMLISDYLSLNFVDRVFESPLSYSGFENLMATYGYALQIYCDFSGYSDIAIGLALLLGFKLGINFNSPYKASNITDFWRRWHISLSTWLRDYLYIPLGGNRKGKIRTYINLMITMLLGGLWHGANARFVIWGAIHGIALIITKLTGIEHKANQTGRWQKFGGIVLTFNIVCFSWIFFRANNLQTAGEMLTQIFTRFGWQSLGQMIWNYGNIFGVMLLGYAMHWLPFDIQEVIRGKFVESKMLVKFAIAIIAVVIIVQFKSTEIQPFIYFRF